MAEQRPDNEASPDNDRVDAELLQRIAARDRQALTALYHRYYHPLLRFVHRLTGDLELAQEAVNDVMVVVWNKASGFEARSKVSTWILGIAYRKGMGLKSRLNKWNLRFKAADWESDVEPVARIEALTVDLERQDLLKRALQRLTPKQRAVVELAYFFGLSYEEIASIVQCPENTVKTRMFHARARLKAVMQQLGEDTSHE